MPRHFITVLDQRRNELTMRRSINRLAFGRAIRLPLINVEKAETLRVSSVDSSKAIIKTHPYPFSFP